MARRPEEWPVYGGPGFVPMPQPYRAARIIVCAPSGAAARRAMEAVGWTVSRGDWAFGWCETGNELEVAVARACPEVPLYQPERGSGHDWPRGAWIPLPWSMPEHQADTRALARAVQGGRVENDYVSPDVLDCLSCGASIEECDKVCRDSELARSCCATCKNTATHTEAAHRARSRAGLRG
jgi:hypothetical protein